MRLVFHVLDLGRLTQETGEYAFDFAVVLFGVLPLVVCQGGLLILPAALQLLRTQVGNPFCHWMAGLPFFLISFSYLALSAPHYKGHSLVSHHVFYLTLVIEIIHGIHDGERRSRHQACVGLVHPRKLNTKKWSTMEPSAKSANALYVGVDHA